jgi:hypothetical protein
MAEPRLQHTSQELIEVAKILDALDKFSGNAPDFRLEGELSVYWEELQMGKIVNDGGLWVYYPEASEKPA